MSRRASSFRPSGLAAFSLVELLVAMAVLAVLLMILLSVVNGTTRMWRTTENRVDSFRETRAALGVINNDLKALVVSREPGHFALDVTTGLPDSAIKPATANNIFFLAALPSDQQDATDTNDDKIPDNASEICIVGYFLAYDSPTFGRIEPSMNLYRYFLSSGPSFQVLKKGGSLAKDISTTAGSANVEVLARNVTGFQIKAFKVGPNGPESFKNDGTQGLPDFLDLQITALNNESARKMKKEHWHNPESGMMKNIFSQEARTFSTRVNLAPFQRESTESTTATP
jgi:prepilin-type N-terminal cleavage/methylation domain-containing protein